MPLLKPLISMRQFLVFLVVAVAFLGGARGQDAPGAFSSGEELSSVDQLLQGARDLFDLGRYGMADRKCRQILALDPQNREALHGRELIRQARDRLAASRAAGDRYAETVIYPQIAWELPSDPGNTPQGKARAAQAEALKVKLLRIIIPDMEFCSVPLREVVVQLSAASRACDPAGADGGARVELQLPEAPPAGSTVGPGVPTMPEGSPAENAAPGGLPVAPLGPEPFPMAQWTPANTPITLHVTHLDVLNTLYAISHQAGLKIKVDPDRVLLVPPDAILDQPLITMAMAAPKFFFDPPGDPAAGSDDGATEIDAKELLKSSGVTFPPGAKAVYLRRTGRLVVRNTSENLDLVMSIAAPLSCFPAAGPDATPLPVTNP